jgi:hypothetical protein
LKKPFTKKGWLQGVVSEFKPQYYKKKKKTKKKPKNQDVGAALMCPSPR